MLPLVSPQKKDVWETSLEMTYWWRVTTLIWVMLLIGWSNFFFISYHRSICFCLSSMIALFRVSLVPSCSRCSPLFPCSPCYPLFTLVLLFSLVPPVTLCSLVPPCSPLFPLFPFVPLFPLVPLVPPCSPFPPLFLLFPSFPCSPFFPFVPSYSPCSPVPLVNLQFTTLNVWQSQISVNKKNRSPFRRNPLKSRIPSHKHVKVLHLIWWRQLV